MSENVRIVSITEARTHLYRLVDEVSKGREFVITRNGKPVARLVPVKRQDALRRQ